MYKRIGDIMEHIHSIIIIKKENKYLNYYDDRWKTYLFPNIKGNDIEEIKNMYHTENVELLFDKVHDKYSPPNKEVKTYHHYFYIVKEDINGEYFTLDELLSIEKVRENNSDVIGYIREYFDKNS